MNFLYANIVVHLFACLSKWRSHKNRTGFEFQTVSIEFDLCKPVSGIYLPAEDFVLRKIKVLLKLIN